jgi:hypothetical protein
LLKTFLGFCQNLSLVDVPFEAAVLNCFHGLFRNWLVKDFGELNRVKRNAAEDVLVVRPGINEFTGHFDVFAKSNVIYAVLRWETLNPRARARLLCWINGEIIDSEPQAG